MSYIKAPTLNEINQITDTGEIARMMSTIANLKPDIPIPPKEGAIIDENQTVVWNREEVACRRTAYSSARLAFRQEQNALLNACEQRLLTLFQYKTGVKNDDVFKCIYEKAYELAYAEGHAYGYGEVINYLDQYIDYGVAVYECTAKAIKGND